MHFGEQLLVVVGMRSVPGHSGGAARRPAAQPSVTPATGGAKPPVHDPQLAAIFHSMRRMLGLPIDRLARVFGMPAPVIQALEAGRIDLLPDWAETLRVVRAYADAVQIDPTPIFARLQVHMGPIDYRALLQQGGAAAALAKSSATGRTVTAPSATVTKTAPGTKAPPSKQRLQRRRRRLMALAPFALLALVLATVQLVPSAVYAFTRLLPAPVASPVTAGLDFLVYATAPQREGLRWIDVGNPRARKSDRLRPTKR